jgi:hypothetical protein
MKTSIQKNVWLGTLWKQRLNKVGCLAFGCADGWSRNSITCLLLDSGVRV